MPRSKELLYRPVLGQKVPGFVIDKVGDDRVSPMQLPFKEGFIPGFSQIVVGLGSSNSNPELVQISPSHRRVFEMRYNSSGFIFWDDEYKNIYGVLQDKGGNVTDPGARIEGRAPSGFMILGIQESDSILRTIRASNLMRSRNIATEAIVRLVEPTQLQFEGKPVSAAQFKSRLVEKVWQEDKQRAEGDEGERGGSVTREDIPRLASELKDMAFYLTTLGRQVSERFFDLKFVSSKKDLKRIMRRVFTFWNARAETWKKMGIEAASGSFNNQDVEDICRFFATTLPAEIARNYALLHGELDLLHTYPHLGNVSLVGSIYDDDSVYGEPLGFGDEKVTEEQKMAEVDFLMRGKYGFEHADGIINLLKSLEQKRIIPMRAKVSKTFARTFFMEYLKDRGWVDNFAANVKHVMSLLDSTEIYLFSEEDKDVKRTLIETVGQENVDLLMRDLLLRSYGHSLVVDPDDILLPTQEVQETVSVAENLTREREEEIAELAGRLLGMHRDHLIQHPASGKDYFSFPKIPCDLFEAHKGLQKDEVRDIVRLWIEGKLPVVNQGYEPRAVGSFLLTLTQANTNDALSAVRNVPIAKDDLELIAKISRLHEFFEVLPAGRWYRDYLQDLIGDLSEKYFMEQEIGYRVGITLFGRGIITKSLHEIFNHHLWDIILNEFTTGEVQALKEAAQCPELVDHWGGRDNVVYFLKTGLTGIQVREGQMSGLALIAGEGIENVDKVTSSNLQYFFASIDKDEIKDEKLKRAMSIEIGSDWAANMVEHLIVGGKVLHPNSFLAQTIKETEIGADYLADILKTALDLNDGDLEKTDFTLKGILEAKSYEGVISKKKAVELVWSCMGFGVDLPEILESCLAQKKNRYVLMDFLSERSVLGEAGAFRKFKHYPISPVYSLMSRGVEALPRRLAELFFKDGDEKEVLNSLAGGILNHLFNDEYIRFYFGGLVDLEHYPQPTIDLRSLRFDKTPGKNGFHIWKIVHPDIWDILKIADPEILEKFFRSSLRKGRVQVEFGVKDSRHGLLYGMRDTPLSECLPPDLYRKLSGLPS